MKQRKDYWGERGKILKTTCRSRLFASKKNKIAQKKQKKLDEKAKITISLSKDIWGEDEREFVDYCKRLSLPVE